MLVRTIAQDQQQVVCCCCSRGARRHLHVGLSYGAIRPNPPVDDDAGHCSNELLEDRHCWLLHGACYVS
jgi:hypothetical protein